MLRTINAEPTLWDGILPECCLGLPPGLAEVDRLLDDSRFFEPFVPFFSARTGRPSIPMETYLRMMFLRFRYKLGFETLYAEVADSIAWRRFCRIPLDTAVPHPTTLLKITARCGDSAISALNEVAQSRLTGLESSSSPRVRSAIDGQLSISWANFLGSRQASATTKPRQLVLGKPIRRRHVAPP